MRRATAFAYRVRITPKIDESTTAIRTKVHFGHAVIVGALGDVSVFPYNSGADAEIIKLTSPPQSNVQRVDRYHPADAALLHHCGHCVGNVASRYNDTNTNTTNSDLRDSCNSEQHRQPKRHIG